MAGSQRGVYAFQAMKLNKQQQNYGNTKADNGNAKEGYVQGVDCVVVGGLGSYGGATCTYIQIRGSYIFIFSQNCQKALTFNWG